MDNRASPPNLNPHLSPASPDPAVTALSAVISQLLGLLREERQERNDLRRRVEKLEQLLEQARTEAE